MAEVSILKTVGQVAGIGGLALGVLLLLFRDFIRKAIFPTLAQAQAYRLLRLFLLLVWAIALVGVAAWVWVETRPKLPPTAWVPDGCKPSMVTLESGFVDLRLTWRCEQNPNVQRLVIDENLETLARRLRQTYTANTRFLLPSMDEYANNPTPAKWKIVQDHCDRLLLLASETIDGLLRYDSSLEHGYADLHSVSSLMYGRTVLLFEIRREEHPVSAFQLSNYSRRYRELVVLLEQAIRRIQEQRGAVGSVS